MGLNLIEGIEKFATLGGVITVGFRIDAGVQVVATRATRTFRKGDIILGFRATVTEAVVGTTSTVQLGFTGTKMLSAAIAEATLVAAYIFGPDIAGDKAQALTLLADDTFDCIVGVNTLTAGKFDVEVAYVPALDSALGSNFTEWITV